MNEIKKIIEYTNSSGYTGGCLAFRVNNEAAALYKGLFVLTPSDSPLEFSRGTWKVDTHNGERIGEGTFTLADSSWYGNMERKMVDLIDRHYAEKKTATPIDDTRISWSSLKAGDSCQGGNLIGKYVAADGTLTRISAGFMIQNDLVKYWAFSKGEELASGEFSKKGVLNYIDKLCLILEDIIFPKLVYKPTQSELKHTHEIYDGSETGGITMTGKISLEKKDEGQSQNEAIIQLLKQINSNLEVIAKNTTKTHSIQFAGNVIDYKLGSP